MWAFAKPRALRLISSCCFVPRRSYSQVHSLTLCCCIAQYHYFLRYQWLIQNTKQEFGGNAYGKIQGQSIL